MADHLLNCSTNDYIEVPDLARPGKPMRPPIFISVVPRATALNNDLGTTS